MLYFGLNGLHAIWPQIPDILVSYKPLALFQVRPWISVGYTEMWFSLAGIGFFYLLPSDILFSLWFFFLLARFQELVGGMEGSFTPLDVVGYFISRSRLRVANLTLFSFSDALFSRDLRGIVLTGFLDSQKLADETKLARRKLLAVFVAAIIFAIVVGGVLHVWLPYRHGAVTMYGYVYRGNSNQFWHENQSFITIEEPYNPRKLASFFSGVALCAGSGLMRRHYLWWPLHPLGAALSVSWILCVFWFPMLVAWLIKTVITRYGGVKLYLKLRPAFLGLIFGEYFMAVLWVVISWFFGTEVPRFPWP